MPGRPRPHGDGGTPGDGPDDSGSPSRGRGGRSRSAGSVAEAQRTTESAAQAGRPGNGSAGGAPPGTPQRALPPGGTTRSLAQVRNIRNRQDRARAAEEYARELYGGTGQRHYPVTPDEDADFPVTRPGGRHVDVPVDLPDGTTMAVEVKMYQQYRTVSLPDGTSEAQRVEVPLRPEIREQINKDVALRNADPSYDPRWAFLGAGPSPALRDYLTKAGFIFTETR